MKKETVGVFGTLSDKQKSVVYAMIAHALETSNDDDDGEGGGDGKTVKHSNNGKGESKMKKNIFDKTLRPLVKVHCSMTH